MSLQSQSQRDLCPTGWDKLQLGKPQHPLLGKSHSPRDAAPGVFIAAGPILCSLGSRDPGISSRTAAGNELHTLELQLPSACPSQGLLGLSHTPAQPLHSLGEHFSHTIHVH